MSDTEHVFKNSLKNQYHAALAMLREGIAHCSDEIWLSNKHPNAPWQVAYHTLYFTHLYLQPNEHAFQPWEQHQADVQHPDGYAGPPDPESSLPLIPTPYTRSQVLEYWKFCDAMVDPCLDRLDLAAPADGFSWKRNVVVSQAQFQLTNIRHIQNGATQLASRLRAEGDIGIEWVGNWERTLG